MTRDDLDRRSGLGERRGAIPRRSREWRIVASVPGTEERDEADLTGAGVLA